jgi:hypothetical protein
VQGTNAMRPRSCNTRRHERLLEAPLPVSNRPSLHKAKPETACGGVTARFAVLHKLKRSKLRGIDRRATIKFSAPSVSSAVIILGFFAALPEGELLKRTSHGGMGTRRKRRRVREAPRLLRLCGKKFCVIEYWRKCLWHTSSTSR